MEVEGAGPAVVGVAADELNLEVDFWLPATLWRMLSGSQRGDPDADAMLAALGRAANAAPRCLLCGGPVEDSHALWLFTRSAVDTHAHRICECANRLACCPEPLGNLVRWLLACRVLAGPQARLTSVAVH